MGNQNIHEATVVQCGDPEGGKIVEATLVENNTFSEANKFLEKQ